jgi:ABC-type glycerol-3-phosphate transport system substrate-binding protein
MRRIANFLVAVAVVALAAGCGGGSDSPSGITKSIYSQFQKGNYEKGVEVFVAHLDSDNEGTAEEKQQFIKGFTEKAKASMDEQGGIKSFEIVKETISEDGVQATVETKITYGNGSTKDESLKFVKKDGAWKISLGK